MIHRNQIIKLKNFNWHVPSSVCGKVVHEHILLIKQFFFFYNWDTFIANMNVEKKLMIYKQTACITGNDTLISVLIKILVQLIFVINLICRDYRPPIRPLCWREKVRELQNLMSHTDFIILFILYNCIICSGRIYLSLNINRFTSRLKYDILMI